jgi:hypothetical protein
LNAGDLFFKAVAFQMEKSALAVRQALNEGLVGDAFLDRVDDLIKNMPAEHYIKSIDEMHVATFTNDMEGDFFKGIKQTLNRTPGASLAVPFFGTLINLASWSARRTPLALVTPSFTRAMKKGGIAADKAIGQAVMGSMIYWQVSEWTRQGKITGSGSFLSEATRMNWFKSGWRPNSILDENGVFHSIQGGAPFTTIVSFYATLAEAWGFMEDDKVRTDIAMGAAFMFGDIVLDQTFARGIYEFLDAIHDPALWKSETRVRSLAGSFSPNWLRWVRKVVDPEKRETNIGELYTLAGFGDRLKAEFMNRIPGLSDNLPPAVTYFGEPPPIGYDAMMVFPESKLHPDQYLYNNLDRNGVLMRKPKPVLRLAGQDIDLNEMVPDARGQGYSYYQWQVFLGKARKEVASRVINSSAFEKADPGKAGEGKDGVKNRGDLLQRAMGKAREIALGKMMKAYPGTDFAELVKQEMANASEEVHPVMPQIKRGMTGNEPASGVRFNP